MSFKITGAVWDMDLPFSEAWVLMAMADHADHNGRNVKAGIKLIAYKTGYSTRSVQRHMMKLRERGILVMERNREREHLPNIYRIDVNAAPKKPPRDMADDGDGESPPHDKLTGGVRHPEEAPPPPRQIGAGSHRQIDAPPATDCRGGPRQGCGVQTISKNHTDSVDTDVSTISLRAHARDGSAADAQPRARGRKSKRVTPAVAAAFEPVWRDYPGRGPRSNPKQEALEQFADRVAEGETVTRLHTATKNFRAAMEAVARESGGREGVGTATTMQAKRFFGASCPYEQYVDGSGVVDKPVTREGSAGARGGHTGPARRHVMDPDTEEFWSQGEANLKRALGESR